MVLGSGLEEVESELVVGVMELEVDVTLREMVVESGLVVGVIELEEVWVQLRAAKSGLEVAKKRGVGQHVFVVKAA